MKIAITGASGHLGINFVRHLNELGIRPRVLLYEQDEPLNQLDVELMEGDVRHLDSLQACFSNIDMVYHLAAKISIRTDEEEEVRAINVEGTKNVIKACLDRKVGRLVHVSSIHAFNHFPQQEDINESRALVNRTQGYPYDRSKADGVRAIEEGIKQGLNSVIVFPTGLIGPYDYKLSFMGKFFLDLYHGKFPFLINGEYNFADVRDMVLGIRLAGKHGKKGERYLMGGHNVSIRQFATLASEITGINIPKIFLPIPLVKSFSPLINCYAHLTHNEELKKSISPVVLDILKFCPTINDEKSKKELGYQTRPTRETVQAIYYWFNEAGLI